MSLATQFGIGGQEGITFDKFKSVATSDFIMDKVLMSTAMVKVKDKKPSLDLIGHHLMSELKLRESWKNKPNLAKVNLNLKGSSQDTVKATLLKSIKSMVTVSENKEKLIVINVISKNENLAYAINKSIVAQTVDFFKKSAVSSDEHTLEIIQNKLDSIKSELYQNENRYADRKDNSFQTVKIKGHVDLLRIERNIKLLNEMYVEAIKQHEMINFKILNNTPSIQLVDSPSYPLEIKKRSRLLVGIGLAFVGFFLTLIALKGFEFYQSLMEKVKSQSV